MSKDDIERAVQEAEQFAEEDKKRKEAVDTRNNADQMVYQAEKTIADFGDKLTDEEKASIQTPCDALKEALKGENLDDIKAKQEELQKAVFAVSEKIYKATQGAADPNAAGAPGADAGAAPNADNVYDAEFTEDNGDNK